ncbi:PREDICTED: uncharacterized protein LOC105567310, partial [Vollenhovia emeryi]|uniref:uncharacterized protein LOC105567310 n=1 Tax=Vollenhovia emeryi TaxID=411798 RepID=UPI0005F3EF9D
VFNTEQELNLVDYILRANAIYFGLTPREVRQVAYSYGTFIQAKMPPSWVENERAGVDWFSSFLKRHPILSIRTPEATSLARVSAFNPITVKRFFDNLKEILDEYPFTSAEIWNCDETGVTTVQKPTKIVGKRGERQTGRITSGERGKLVTMIVAVNAIGHSTPPYFIFPRVKYASFLVEHGPVGSTGSANPSGWMNEDIFVEFLKHFAMYSRCSKERPVLLLLDNHSSHISVAAINFARGNGIIMLSLPPHCSNKMQPLDVSVYGPFKKAYNTACDSWITNNPGKMMTYHSIPGIVKTAISVSITPRNIVAGFKKTGIQPFNSEIFNESDFLPASVTDRSKPIGEIESVSIESVNKLATNDATEYSAELAPISDKQQQIELTPQVAVSEPST